MYVSFGIHEYSDGLLFVVILLAKQCFLNIWLMIHLVLFRLCEQCLDQHRFEVVIVRHFHDLRKQ